MSGYRDPRYPYPTGPRLSSTSAVYDTSFDTKFGPPLRSPVDSVPSRVGRAPYYTPSNSRSTLDTTHPHSSSHALHTHRPRRNSSTEPYGRASLTVLPSETSGYNRPVIRTLETPRSSVPKIYTPKDDTAGIVHPAVSRRHHERHASATTDDLSRLSLVDKDRLSRQRSHRNSYVAPPREYTAPRRPTEEQFSYTGPREQFDRDYPARQTRPHRDSYTRSERPTSMADYDYKPPVTSRREPPPSSMKHFDRLEKNDLLRPGSRSGAGTDIERDIRRHESTKKPVAVHHHHDRDEGYSSQRDDYGDRKYLRPDRPAYEDDRNLSDRDRHHHSSHHARRSSRSRHERHESKERSGLSSALAAAGLSATGLAAAVLKDKHEDRSSRDKERGYDSEHRRAEKERRHQDRDSEYETERREHRVDRNQAQDQPKEKSESDSGRERRHRRRRHRDQAATDASSESSSELLNATAAATTGSAVDSSLEEPKERHHRHKHRHRRHRSRDPDAREIDPRVQDAINNVEYSADTRADEINDQKPRKSVTVVEPSKEEGSEPKQLKGILKPPRPAFPEDPNPTREGVAPMKDATKKGVPQGARWTKINRILVNPEALEAAQERFEERDDYVIVLRVLSREEVQKLADKTREIRESREKTERKPETNEEERRRPARRSRRGDDDGDESDTESDVSSSTDSYSSYEEDRHTRRRHHSRGPSERKEQRLEIEAPPEQYAHPWAQPGAQAEGHFTPAQQPAQVSSYQAIPPQQMQPQT